MIAHRFAITPRMDFQTKTLGFARVDLPNVRVHGGLAQSQPSGARVERSADWFGFWETREDASDFVVTESSRTLEDVTDALPNLA